MKNSIISASVRNILEGFNIDPKDEDLKDTPERVENAMREMLSGYDVDDKQFYKLFKATDHDMVIVKDIGFNSLCKHHLLPFSGTVSIGYIPNKYIIGLSKFSRIVDCFSKRLQLQENLTREILKSIEKHLKPLGAIVLMKASHNCMSCRGVKQSDAVTVTLAKSGEFEKNDNLNCFFNML
ncbi:MAG: GTP cyclohydrolase I FolE [Rickettsiales bacterium]|nr:GTP cyclohydrolase I FolE [Rickettsiales bacterium]